LNKLDSSITSIFPTASIHNNDAWPWKEHEKILPSLMPNGQPWPKITVVTPSYNQGKYIEETIRSILLQGYPNLEYIIMDAGSTDQTLDIIKKYSAWITYWESKPDRGQSHAINKGFSRASGDIFAWLNSDDYYLPNALYHIANSYIKNKQSYWVGVGSAKRIDGKGRLEMIHVPTATTFQKLIDWDKYWFMQPACFFSAAIWKDHGILDEDLHLAMDFELWLRFSKQVDFTLVDQVLCVNRNYNETKTRSMRGESIAEGRVIQFRYGGEEEAKRSIAEYVNQTQEALKLWNILASFPGRKFVQKIFSFFNKKK